ncbi:hypothetical protein TSAR_015197 [Trichomalopsis sarcophagae]|uniref:Outer dense fiber protein 3 n=1 Tax=Trichomalopsis sarcophagae TaxID=543379 RepID=A0A232EPL6_9HYME|nr:hypothetical protein TSAR_015197 [Trichomalopsis sarcophagae]
MPSKKIDKQTEGKESKTPLHKTLTCGTRTPGPKYKLKSLVGYDDHCHSKYRNPAYTIGKKQKAKEICLGPGPKYLYNLPGIPGYSFPRSAYRPTKDCSPGPKYTLPGFSSPAFSIANRPKAKCDKASPGPYDPYPLPIGPTFVLTGRGKYRKCEYNPPMRDVGPVTLLKPNSPAFSIVSRQTTKDRCKSPGPKYFPALMKKSPEYTFGLKHSECSIIPRTECDELC